MRRLTLPIRRCVKAARTFADSRRGATAVEYGLILSLIVLALIAGVTQLGNSTNGLWGNVNTKVGNAGSGS